MSVKLASPDAFHDTIDRGNVHQYTKPSVVEVESRRVVFIAFQEPALRVGGRPDATGPNILVIIAVREVDEPICCDIRPGS